MKAAIFNPYLDTLGGGERYTLSFAKVLAEKGYKVDIEWNSPQILKTLEKRFGINLGSEGNIRVVNSIEKGDGYDLCFWVSDGSIPSLRARKNFLHFQVPFHDVAGQSLINKMKLFRINQVICNSEFTKSFIDKEFGTKSVVIYPPVDTLSIKTKRKENIILYVGRFSGLLQNKNQDLLIKNFKKLVDRGLSGWKLVLAGGVEIGVGETINEMRKVIGNYPIEIIESPSFKDLKDLYGKSRIFWSASGFGEDETKQPEKVEHFGITIVEAMSAGVVPVICNVGGHKEVVIRDESGFLWNNESQLLRYTEKVISDKGLLRKISLAAISRSHEFSYEKFESNIGKIL